MQVDMLKQMMTRVKVAVLNVLDLIPGRRSVPFDVLHAPPCYIGSRKRNLRNLKHIDITFW